MEKREKRERRRNRLPEGWLLWVENHCLKIVKISLRGNKSKQAFFLVTERFRCHSLTSGQDRCQVFVSGRFGCFADLAGVSEEDWALV